MKLRVYLDTSVFSAYYDARVLDRLRATRAFWARSAQFHTATSEVARLEASMTPDGRLRRKLYRLIGRVTVYPISSEMREVAGRFIELGVIPATKEGDALRVAAAILTRQDVLVSWNFRHLVNRRRRALVNQASIALGLPAIDIVAPPEL